MCRAASEQGGPRRCSSDARAAAERSQAIADALRAQQDQFSQALHGPRALSPSRALDYRRCPRLFRFRVIERIPEEPSPAALRGTVVHAALEHLHNLPAPQRTPQTAHALLEPAWQQVHAAQPAAAALTPEQKAALLDEAAAMLARYYTVEDPTRFSAESTETRFKVCLEDGTPLRGIIDRIDVAPDGRTRVVDYKTGKCPPEAFQSDALFQVKFYALALLISRGVLPTQLRLVYLGDGTTLDFAPSRTELERFAHTVSALWQQIQTATATDNFPPQPSGLCKTCAHRSRCPAFSGS